MKATLAIGLSITKRYTVDKTKTIDFMGEELRVYATPSMARDIEFTCRNFLKEHLDASEDSVGARIELDHLGPTLLDMWVDVSAKIVELDRRRVVFECEVRDALDVVGKSRHVRFVVDTAKQKERLEAKRAKVRAAGA
jgi:predicted thioesterase